MLPSAFWWRGIAVAGCATRARARLHATHEGDSPAPPVQAPNSVRSKEDPMDHIPRTLLGPLICSRGDGPVAVASRFASLPPTFDPFAYWPRRAGTSTVTATRLLLGNAASPIGVYVNDGSAASPTRAPPAGVSPAVLHQRRPCRRRRRRRPLDALLGNRVTRANQVHLNNGLGVFTFSPGALPTGQQHLEPGRRGLRRRRRRRLAGAHSSFAGGNVGGNTSRFYETTAPARSRTSPRRG